MALAFETYSPLERAEPTAYVAYLHTQMTTIRDAWLVCETEGVCTAYQRYQWVETIVSRLLRDGKGSLLIVELRSVQTGELVMILPLTQRRYLGYNEIGWLNCGVCDYSAPLMARPFSLSAEEAQTAWAAVRSVLPRADRLRITAIPARISANDNPLALLCTARESNATTSGLVITGPAETLIKRVCKPSFSKDFNAKYRKLQRIGTVHFEEAKTALQLETIFGVLVEQRLSRFRQLGRFDLLTQSAYVDFYLDTARQGLADGSVRVFGLRVDADWIATCYVLIHAGRVHGILLAMEQGRWHSASPGLLIIAKVMEWACSQGLDYLDMSVGSLHYKQRIGADSATLLEIDETLTAMGRMVGVVSQWAERMKKEIHDNPRIHAGLRRCRALLRNRRLYSPT